MKVRRTVPKIVGETPKAPMYFDKSCSCGGADEGYDGGKDTKTEKVTWSCGSGNLLFVKQESAPRKLKQNPADIP